MGSGQSPSAAPRSRPASRNRSCSAVFEPDGSALLPDGRIFVAEKNGRIKVFDNLADTTPTLFADLSTNVYNFWDKGLLGLDRSRLPDRPVRLRALHVRPRAWKHRAAAPLEDAGRPLRSVPDAAGADRRRLPRQRPSLPPPGIRERDGRERAGVDRGLVPAVSQPSTGSLAFGSDGALYASGGDGAMTLRRLRPGRKPAQPRAGILRERSVPS